MYNTASKNFMFLVIIFIKIIIKKTLHVNLEHNNIPWILRCLTFQVPFLSTESIPRKTHMNV